MNEIIEKIYSTGVVEDDQNNQYPCDSSITYDAGLLLYDLIREYRPRKSLEIGFAYGLSTLFICQALFDNGQGAHTAIDPYETTVFKSIGLLNIKRSGLGEIFRFYDEPSYGVLPKLTEKNEAFDFAFIDGSHLFDFTIVEFFYIDKLLTQNGLVIFDDLWMPGVRKAVSYVLHNRAYRLVKPIKQPVVGWELKLARMLKRIVQNPFERDWKLKLIPYNVAILQKIGADERDWKDHRKF